MNGEKLFNEKTVVWMLLAMGLWLTGCFDEIEGVPCVEAGDCVSGICQEGTCYEPPSGSDGDTDADADGDSDADADGIPVVYTEPMTAVDILFVVDNSRSMIQEQEILTSSIYTLVNSLTEGMLGQIGPVVTDLDIRLAVTSTDMGVSFSGQPYDREFPPAPSCQGMGGNGQMITSYLDPNAIAGGEVISCSKSDNGCPPNWVCASMDASGNGVCQSPNGASEFGCPDINMYLENDMYIVPNAGVGAGGDYRNFVAAGACLANVGTAGCAFEQQLAAVPAALTQNGQQVFLRKEAMTVIVVVTDENDCSLASDQWHNSDELGTPETNIACGMHENLLTNVSTIKSQIIAAKTHATGISSEGSIVFAAITGVPVVPECQGAGNAIGGCLNVPLSQGGTVGDPNIVERHDPNENLASYYEYACERFEGDTAVTQAYPALRIVQLAQQFGEYGFVYSICNQDWTPAMTGLATMINARLAP